MNNVTDEIKSRLDIVELINGYTPLRKAGRNYNARCPFHDEKTPSFIVFPESQTWRCFGACSEGGDIFSFVMKREGWDFPETLRVLAERAGVELEPVTPAAAASKETADRLRLLLTDTAHFFHRQLLNTSHAAHAKAYVERRGLRPETLDRFQIGYAPDGWETTISHLAGLGYEREEMVAAGLVVVKDDGSSYDRFRDRLLIPIRDARGQMVGFGARALAKDAMPKYLNSPQSELFDKSSLLFGLDMARRSIRESETAVIVEGYMDVIQAHQAGYTNVVAQMGTALTELQLRMLARYAKRLILALDPDAAGQMATERGVEVIERVSKAAAEQATEEGMWDFDAAERDYRAKLTAEFDLQGMVRYESRLGFDIRVMILPDGHDPDDVIRDTPQAWPEMINNAVPIIEYVIQSTIAGKNLNDPKIKSQIAKQITPLIMDVADPIERSHYRQRLARLLRVDERALFPESGGTGQAAKAPKPMPNRDGAAASDQPTQELFIPSSPTALMESFCLASLMRFTDLLYKVNRVMGEYLDREELCRIQPSLANIEWPELETIQPGVAASDFVHPQYRAIFEAWQAALEQDHDDPMQYLSQTLDPSLYRTIEEWRSTPLDQHSRGVAPAKPPEVADDTLINEAIHRLLGLRRHRIEEYLKEIEYVMQDDETGGLTVKEYASTITVLSAALKRLAQARQSSSFTRRLNSASEVKTYNKAS